MDYVPSQKDKDVAKQQQKRGTLGLTAQIRKILGKTDETGATNYEKIAELAINKLTENKLANRDFITLLTYISDRVEGKPVSVELVGHMNADNPLMSVDTDVLTRRLEAIKIEQNKQKAIDVKMEDA